MKLPSLVALTLAAATTAGAADTEPMVTRAGSRPVVAAPDRAMTHIAIRESQGGTTVTWTEAVTDAQYGALPGETKATPTARPSRAQQLLGDIALKLAQLTDDVLFGDVWQRPGLSPRERSLATVSALIALNRPDQLRSHLSLARQNGLTETELVEALT